MYQEYHEKADVPSSDLNVTAINPYADSWTMIDYESTSNTGHSLPFKFSDETRSLTLMSLGDFHNDVMLGCDKATRLASDQMFRFIAETME